MLAEYQNSLEPLFHNTAIQLAAVFNQAVPGGIYEPVGRSKQLRSIVAKLQRQPTKLASMQDLVGFRVIVPRAPEQQRLLDLIPQDSSWRIMDRRNQPAHGYRAVHIIRTVGAGRVEVQIRTLLQHYWAELSEGYDRLYPGVKYGQGDEVIISELLYFSH